MVRARRARPKSKKRASAMKRRPRAPAHRLEHRAKTAKPAAHSVASIDFCSKCGSIMVPVKKRTSVVLLCRRCGTEKKKDVKALKIVEAPKKQKAVAVIEKDTTPLPMTLRDCPECGNRNAYFWLQQTRSADEPPTQFFRCTKCKFTWREYK